MNGLTAGYQGVGAKTVIGSVASAKVSMRLVPNQVPATVQAAFEQALRDRLPTNVKHAVQWFGASAPVLVPIDSRPTQLAAEALTIGFGKPSTFMREGGSIPVVGLLKRALDLDTLLIGFGLPDDRVHSPNEKFNLSPPSTAAPGRRPRCTPSWRRWSRAKHDEQRRTRTTPARLFSFINHRSVFLFRTATVASPAR